MPPCPAKNGPGCWVYALGPLTFFPSPHPFLPTATASGTTVVEYLLKMCDIHLCWEIFV